MKTHSPLSVAILLALIFTYAAAQPSSANTDETVLVHYLKVQSALARDSMKNVSASVQAIAAAVRADETTSLPTAIADQADALAEAKNLANARKAFKSLSESIIAYFKANGSPQGTYFEVYCPIAKASWLQTGETVKNPYLGPRSATPTWGWACSAVMKAKLERPSPTKS